MCISPHKHLGGAEATGLLIARLAAYDNTKPPSFPGFYIKNYIFLYKNTKGGGTVKAVVGLGI